MSSKIVLFANQKGGVGKTTLCALFANYLTRKRKEVLVIDADFQRSLSQQREDESNDEYFSKLQEPYNVYQFDLDSRQKTEQLMNEMRKVEGYVLIDSPGSITDDAIIPLLKMADVILVPFDYSNVILKSTVRFVEIFAELTKDESKRPLLIFVPNRIEKGVGLKEERELWQRYDENFSNLGVLTPKIYKRYNFTRYNTYEISIEDSEAVKAAFNRIIKEINNI